MMTQNIDTEVDQLNDLDISKHEIFSVIPDIDKAKPVPVLDADTLSEAEFRKDWVANNRACLVKGAVKHWPAVEKWRSKEYWITNCEDFKVAAFAHLNHNDFEKQTLIDDDHMSFHNAIHRLYNNEDHVFSIPSEEIRENNGFSTIIKDLGEFNFLKSPNMPRTYERRRFFTYRRAATAWHYHRADETLMCQIKGTKRVALLPPDIPRTKYVTNFLENELHLEGQSLDKNLDLKPMIVDVEEGDALYIPPYWHHGVVPVDGEIGYTLAFCWSSPWHKIGDFSNYFVRRLYKEVLWPINRYTLFLPLLAGYAGLLHLIRKTAKN